MSKCLEEEFVVSQADAEIIATLFRQGVSDYPAIIKAVKWNKIKQKQFYDFMITMGYDGFEDFLFDEDTILSLADIRVPEEKYTEFFQNLPIEFNEDFWDTEWYKAAYNELRQFLIELDKHKKKKGYTSYTLDDMKMIIGQTFCPLTQKPENLCAEIQNLMSVRLRRTGKDMFSFNEILLAFDKAFANYFD